MSDTNKYISYLTPDDNVIVLDMQSLYPNLITDDIKGISLTINDVDENSYIGKHLFVNSVRYSEKQKSFITSVKPYIYIIRLVQDNIPFQNGEFSLSVKVVKDETNRTVGDEEERMYISVTDTNVQKLKEYKKEANMLSTKLESYMLIRTNPKLTGNIKLVVDSNYKLYLDTFKVSSVLNDRVYRKYPVSALGNYPYDVKTVFSSLPKSELFKLPTDSYNHKKIYTDYDNQYLTEYEYGAQTNDDNLYPENMRILAPLHIGKHIPDYFCIFRYDGTYNKESYSGADFNDTEMFKKLIKESEVVKIFDLRNYTSIGQYLNNYHNYINDFLYGSCYMQFIEQDTEKYSTDYRQGNNNWKGVDVAKGIITNKIETSYFANDVLTSEKAVQENFNNFIISGYERNNVLYPYILNIEYMFNDETAEELSMHRYFGLYLSENEIVDYDCIIKNIDEYNGIVQKLDADDNLIDDSYVIDRVFTNKFADRIFFMSTNNDAARVQNTEDVKKFINKYVLNNPDKNICDMMAENLQWHDNEKSFITMSFDEPIKYGEHLRFVSLDNYNELTKEHTNICLEIIASNDIRLKETDDFISPYVVTNEPEDADVNDNPDLINHIYRLAFYSQSLVDELESATLKEQFERIHACIIKFKSFVNFESYNDDTIGLSSSDDNVYFQHIAPVNKHQDFTYNYVAVNDEDKKIYFTHTERETSRYIAELANITKYTTESNDITLYKDSVYMKDDKNCDKVGMYVDYTSSRNVVKDNIHYFSKISDSYMHALSPDSVYYSDKFRTFSLYGYDMLGWRYNNIVPFKKISEFRNPCIIYGDIEKELKAERHLLVKSVNGDFETVRNISLSTAYLTDNVLKMINSNSIETQRLNMIETATQVIINPYDVDKCMVDFNIKPFIHNYNITLFNPESAAFSVMGIYNVKDFDMSIDLNRQARITDNMPITIKEGEVVYLSDESDKRVVRNVLYKIEKGSFNEFSAYVFIIIGDKVYYTESKNSNVVNSIDLFSSVLTAASDITIKNNDLTTEVLFDFVQELPVQKVDNFIDSKNASKLSIPVVPQTNCFWESNGLYFDGNSSLDVKNLLNDKYQFNGFFGKVGYNAYGSENANMYVNNSVDSYIQYDEAQSSTFTYKTFRNSMLTGSVRNAIRKMLVQNKNISTAVGYFNAYVQTLEFIYYGIKFILKFDQNYYNQNIKISEYNNFEVFIINEYDLTKDNEIFISIDEEIILMINHQYDVDKNSDFSNKIINVDDLNTAVDFSVYKSPYTIKTDSISYINNYFYAAKSNDSKELSNSKYFAQDDIIENFNSAINDYVPHYFYTSFEKSKCTNKIFNVCQDFIGILKQQEDEYIVTQFDVSVIDKNLTDVKYRKSNAYFITDRLTHKVEKNNKNSLNEYISSFADNDFNCYIINNNHYDKISVHDDYKPIVLSMSIPKKNKYNFGYFLPYTYDIIDFSVNDTELADVVDMSVLLGNTKIDKVNRINTYTGNKIFDNNLSVQNNYFITYEKSIFTSNWDNDFYRLYSSKNERKYANIDGYQAGIEDKTFFGSRCLKLRDEYLLVEDFSGTGISSNVSKVNSKYNTNDKNKIRKRFVINITQAIYNKFKNNETFINNWGEFSNDMTSIKNYIKNVIFKIYNVQREMKLEIYSLRNNDKEEMSVQYSAPEILSEWTLIDNFESTLSTVNDEVLLEIIMDDMKHTTVHPQVKIFRI